MELAIALIGLCVALIALIASAATTYWSWLDRPRFAWALLSTGEQGIIHDGCEGDQLDHDRLAVQALGSGPAYDVKINVLDGTLFEGWADSSMMTASSRPIELHLCRKEGSRPLLLLTWMQHRPRRQDAVCWDIKRQELYRYKWKWAPLRMWGEPGKWVPVSTKVKRQISPDAVAVGVRRAGADHPICGTGNPSRSEKAAAGS